MRTQIKTNLVSASYLYHRDKDARLESIKIKDSPFRLVRTNRSFNEDLKNYIIQTPNDYEEFSCADIRDGIVRIISKFTLSEIKNSKCRKSFAERVVDSILDGDEIQKQSTLENFL